MCDDSCIGIHLNELNNIKMKHDDKDKKIITKHTCQISSRLIEEDNGMNPLHAVKEYI